MSGGACISEVVPTITVLSNAFLPTGAPGSVQFDFAAADFVTDQFEPTSYSTIIDVDLSHTIHLGEASFLDLSGNPVAGITATSENGFTYPGLSVPTAVPEPVGFSLMAVPLVVLASVSIRRAAFG